MEVSSMAISKEQQRAKRAWELVSIIPDGEKMDKYASLAKNAPVMILTNGLGQTLAFLISKSKKGNEYSALFEHLDLWLSENITWTGNISGRGKIMERIINEKSQIYRIATIEALAFLGWIKRFAGAKESKDEGGNK
jgi:CRISPR-associated protein Cmr5